MISRYTLNLTLTMDKPEKSILSFCVGCGLAICDRFMLSVFPDLRWHISCLKCSVCHRNLDESHTCFIKNGKTLCKDDYIRQYGKCAKCHISFRSPDYVMRAGADIYHVHCFRCKRCDRQLLPGDGFKTQHGFLHCTGHESSRHGFITPTRNSVHTPDLDRCDKGAGDSGWLVSPIKSEKAVRVRTSLSKAQLNVLLTCYSANPRPDASLKERLMEMTGLSSRVIRIWFQNKRCKDKKRSMLERQTRHESTQQTDTTDKLVSAATAENLSVNTVKHPLDLQTLDQSWNFLTSLLKSDIDDALNQ